MSKNPKDWLFYDISRHRFFPMDDSIPLSFIDEHNQRHFITSNYLFNTEEEAREYQNTMRGMVRVFAIRHDSTDWLKPVTIENHVPCNRLGFGLFKKKEHYIL